MLCSLQKNYLYPLPHQPTPANLTLSKLKDTRVKQKVCLFRKRFLFFWAEIVFCCQHYFPPKHVLKRALQNLVACPTDQTIYVFYGTGLGKKNLLLCSQKIFSRFFLTCHDKFVTFINFLLLHPSPVLRDKVTFVVKS
jgi:hypothetical protein